MQHTISLQEAIAMTSRYRRHRATIISPAYENGDILPLSETFPRAALEALLAQPGCASIRIYYGMNTELQLHAIIVAADEQNADILSDPDKTDEGKIVDRGNRCPPVCPATSPLNE